MIGVTDFAVEFEAPSKFLVHFSKGTANRFRRPELPGSRFASQVASSTPAPPAGGRRSLLDGLHRRLDQVAVRLPADVRRPLGKVRRRLGL